MNSTNIMHIDISKKLQQEAEYFLETEKLLKNIGNSNKKLSKELIYQQKESLNTQKIYQRQLVYQNNTDHADNPRMSIPSASELLKEKFQQCKTIDKRLKKSIVHHLPNHERMECLHKRRRIKQFMIMLKDMINDDDKFIDSVIIPRWLPNCRSEKVCIRIVGCENLSRLFSFESIVASFPSIIKKNISDQVLENESNNLNAQIKCDLVVNNHVLFSTQIRQPSQQCWNQSFEYIHDFGNILEIHVTWIAPYQSLDVLIQNRASHYRQLHFMLAGFSFITFDEEKDRGFISRVLELYPGGKVFLDTFIRPGLKNKVLNREKVSQTTSWDFISPSTGTLNTNRSQLQSVSNSRSTGTMPNKSTLSPASNSRSLVSLTASTAPKSASKTTKHPESQYVALQSVVTIPNKVSTLKAKSNLRIGRTYEKVNVAPQIPNSESRSVKPPNTVSKVKPLPNSRSEHNLSNMTSSYNIPRPNSYSNLEDITSTPAVNMPNNISKHTLNSNSHHAKSPAAVKIQNNFTKPTSVSISEYKSLPSPNTKLNGISKPTSKPIVRRAKPPVIKITNNISKPTSPSNSNHVNTPPSVKKSNNPSRPTPTPTPRHVNIFNTIKSPYQISKPTSNSNPPPALRSALKSNFRMPVSPPTDKPPNVSKIDAKSNYHSKGSLSSDSMSDTDSESSSPHSLFSSADSSSEMSNLSLNSDFKLLALLGTGHFGKIILVQRIATKKYYAIKALGKTEIINNEDFAQLLEEKKILQINTKCNHPFLVHLFACFQDKKYVMFLLEFVEAGDLATLISSMKSFSESQTKFYAAIIILCIEFLHDNNIIYRDLKMENLLLDSRGYLKLVDFGLSKTNMDKNSRTGTFCGTIDYMAPEMLVDTTYTRMVDWWAVGITVYYMRMGKMPFQQDSDMETLNSILTKAIVMPPKIDASFSSFILLLLDRNPNTRLGSQNGSVDLKNHPFLKQMNFSQIISKKFSPPFIPKLAHPLDLSYFDHQFTKRRPTLDSAESVTFKTCDDESFFDNFC